MNFCGITWVLIITRSEFNYYIRFSSEFRTNKMIGGLKFRWFVLHKITHIMANKWYWHKFSDSVLFMLRNRANNSILLGSVQQIFSVLAIYEQLAYGINYCKTSKRQLVKIFDIFSMSWNGSKSVFQFVWPRGGKRTPAYLERF